MDCEIFVYADLADQPVLAGRLWTRYRKGQETATFEYDRGWLANPACFSLAGAVIQWRTVAARVGLGKAEIEEMTSAFEYRDLLDAR